MCTNGLACQQRIVNHHSRHSFYYRNSSGQHTRIMTTAGMHSCRITIFVDSDNVAQQSGHRLECHTEIYILSVGYATLNTTGMIGSGMGTVNLTICGKPCVYHPASTLATISKAHAVVKSLGSVDAKHSRSQTSLQLSEHRIAQTDRHTLYHA